jgi:hypothetical protein
MSFTRTIEDFTCGHCGAMVKGNGYTNHCPKCLWSKHVDKNPGDRAEVCGGLMEPIRIEGTADDTRIIHRCLKCGVERPVKTSPEDDTEVIIAIAEKAAS